MPGELKGRPLIPTAIRYTIDNEDDILAVFGRIGIWCPSDFRHREKKYLSLDNALGEELVVKPGDWIVPDSKPQTFYVLKHHEIMAFY